MLSNNGQSFADFQFARVFTNDPSRIPSVSTQSSLGFSARIIDVCIASPSARDVVIFEMSLGLRCSSVRCRSVACPQFYNNRHVCDPNKSLHLLLACSLRSRKWDSSRKRTNKKKKKIKLSLKFRGESGCTGGKDRIDMSGADGMSRGSEILQITVRRLYFTFRVILYNHEDYRRI